MNPLLSDMLQSFDYEPNQERFGSGQVRAKYGNNLMTGGTGLPTQGINQETPMMGNFGEPQFDPTRPPGFPRQGFRGRFGGLGRFGDDGFGGQNGMRPEMGQIQDRLSQMMQRWRR